MSAVSAAVCSVSSHVNQKKSGKPRRRGGEPALIRWALTTIPDCWAWRKIFVRRIRGSPGQPAGRAAPPRRRPMGAGPRRRTAAGGRPGQRQALEAHEASLPAPCPDGASRSAPRLARSGPSHGAVRCAGCSSPQCLPGPARRPDYHGADWPAVVGVLQPAAAGQRPDPGRWPAQAVPVLLADTSRVAVAGEPGRACDARPRPAAGGAGEAVVGAPPAVRLAPCLLAGPDSGAAQPDHGRRSQPPAPARRPLNHQMR